MANLRHHAGSTPEFRHNISRRATQVLVVYAIFGLILFIAAGTVRWPEAWVYLALYLGSSVAGAMLIPPEVIAERGARKQNVERWDRVITALATLSTLAIYLVAGLDHRWGWAPSLLWGWEAAAFLICAAGLALFLWAMRVNAYFSTAARLQGDRGQVVCSSGPYRWVRHPGYLGYILFHLATPIFLGSYWALVPAAAFAVVFVVHTWLEDRMLMQRLPGYAEFAAGVRYRLLPGIW